jgi:CBS domain containing-hemolysin-like protein
MDISFLQQTLSEVHLMAPTTGVIIAAVLAAILLLFSGFASGSEIAFFSLSPQDLSELNPEHNTKDAQVKELRDDSARTLATILITNNFVNVTIIMLCNFVFANIVDFGRAMWLQFLCITVLLTFLLLLFGKIMPKIYARQNPLAFCRRMV